MKIYVSLFAIVLLMIIQGTIAQDETTSASSQTDNLSSYTCNNEECNQSCASRGGGNCAFTRQFGDTCYCRKSRLGSEAKDHDIVKQLSACNQEECDRGCRADGREGGNCAFLRRTGHVCFCKKSLIPGR